jgi:hypothetical protein
VTARTHRQAVAAVATATRPINRICAALITLSAGFTVWQLAFRPPIDRGELIIELGLVIVLAAVNILAQQLIRAQATAIIAMLKAVDAAAAAADQQTEAP